MMANSHGSTMGGAAALVAFPRRPIGLPTPRPVAA
jgi:hypothetical protein